jgi:hypothetical protein
MTCKSCGRRRRTAGGLCVECFLDRNLPTKIQDEQWVYVDGRPLTSMDPEQVDLRLQLAVTFLDSRISRDKKTIRLEVDGRDMSIPVRVEHLDALAKKSGVLIGKWLIYRADTKIDRAWRTVATATFNRRLGISAKASTAASKQKEHVICVYTDNYLDLTEVMRVRTKLRTLGFTEELCYKPDLYTHLGIYDGTTILAPYRYKD